MKKTKKKYTITSLDALKAVKKTNRENQVMPKATVTTDKKKKVDKEACRDWDVSDINE